LLQSSRKLRGRLSAAQSIVAIFRKSAVAPVWGGTFSQVLAANIALEIMQEITWETPPDMTTNLPGTMRHDALLQ